ncbi:MAG: sensor histidine kinase [Oscillospiraceae bacterium]
MKATSFWRLFASYIKDHIKVFLGFLLCVFVFTVVFYLNALPPDAIYYATLLCGTLIFIFSIYDFWQFYKKHKQLYELLGGITIGLDKLPDTNKLIEKDYQNLLHKLYDNKVELVSLSDSSRTNMIDYYTLWAHQIKTPIAAISLLLQEDETEQNAKLLQELFKIERYVELVLQYLRLESLSSDLMLAEYSLSDIVKQAIKKYAPLFIHKKIKLEFTQMDCKVLTDEKWLQFVIEQILSNALKYTPTGIISIYMDNASQKILVIEDTGIGIGAEDLPRVFEKGFTGYNGRMDKKSTGIGLYLCHQIVNKLSHKIAIISESDCGTKVKLNLSCQKTFIE